MRHPPASQGSPTPRGSALVMARFAAPLVLALAAFLAMEAAAEPPAPAATDADADEALDASPAPGKAAEAAPQRTRGLPELPPAARSGVWRAGARKPSDVPASVVVRAAKRNPPPAAKRRRRAGPEAEASRTVEIIWNAPGSGS